MAFASAQDSRAAIALLDASGYAKDFSFDWQTESLPVTTLANRAKVFIVGQDSSTAQSGAYLDTASGTTGQWAALVAQKAANTPTPITFGPWGFTTGSAAIMPAVRATQIGASAVVTGVVEAQFAASSTGSTDVGVIVEDFTAITTDTTGTARDGGAGTANGGVAHLHVSAFSDLTNNIVTIEHSANGTTGWATLVTFSTYTGTTSERVEVAAGTTVNRYLRVVDNVTGTGSTTRLVAFARR